MSAYDNAHAAVIRARGPARTHVCVDCGGPALDWSLHHDAYLTYQDEDGVYSLMVSDYDARCRRCHAVYDDHAANLGGPRFGSDNSFFGHHHREESKRYGEANAQAKITAADVLEIRRRVAEGEMQKDVAAAFGLQKMQVSRIIRGERWGHVHAA